MSYFFILLLIVGLTLDALTIIWSYQNSKQKKNISGNFLIPAVLYLIFIINTDLNFIENNKLLVGVILVSAHLFIYLFLPSIFDRLFKEKHAA